MPSSAISHTPAGALCDWGGDFDGERDGELVLDALGDGVRVLEGVLEIVGAGVRVGVVEMMGDAPSVEMVGVTNDTTARHS